MSFYSLFYREFLEIKGTLGNMEKTPVYIFRNIFTQFTNPGTQILNYRHWGSQFLLQGCCPLSDREVALDIYENNERTNCFSSTLTWRSTTSARWPRCSPSSTPWWTPLSTGKNVKWILCLKLLRGITT